jgi:hypothetical protein
MKPGVAGHSRRMRKGRSAPSAWRPAWWAVAGVVTLCGCADVGSREAAAGDTAVRLLTAVAGKDGTAACAILAPDTVAELEQSAGKPCAQAVLDADLPAPSGVSGADVYGQWAQVRLAGETVFLAVFPGGWRVIAAGCEPRQSRPYDCTLQGG